MTNAKKILNKEKINSRLQELNEWDLSDGIIIKKFEFPDFRKAMEFVNKVAEIANKEDHHPDISISYNKVNVSLITHKLGGLTEKDFNVAEKIDNLETD